jgi:hypothetical protein
MRQRGGPNPDEATGLIRLSEESLNIGKGKLLPHILILFLLLILPSSFCQKIKADPDKTLLKCEAKMLKTYLEWRIKTSRIKKESSLQGYWKRLSLAYIDLAGHRMNNGAELDIRDVSIAYLFQRKR